SSRDAMEMKLCRLTGFGIELNGQKSAVLQQLNPGERRTQAQVKRLPMPRPPQRRAHAPGRVAEETDGRQAGEPAAFPEDQTRMQMPDDRLLELRQLPANGV